MSDDKSRARTAKAELTETDAAFEAVREAMIKRLVKSAQSAADERERLYQGIQVLDALRQHMVNRIAAGQVAERADEIAEAVALGTKP